MLASVQELHNVDAESSLYTIYAQKTAAARRIQMPLDFYGMLKYNLHCIEYNAMQKDRRAVIWS